MVFRGYVLLVGYFLGSLAVSVIGVSLPEQAPSPRAGFEEHSVAARIWRAVRHAMLNHMHIHTRAVHAGDSFSRCPIDDLLYGEVIPLSLLPMQESGCDPHLVCHLDFGARSNLRHFCLLKSN